MIDNLHETICDVVFRSQILGKCRSCISSSDRISECRINTSDIHSVILTLNRNFEGHSVFGLDAIGLFGDGITIGFYRQQNAIVFNSLDSDGIGGV